MLLAAVKGKAMMMCAVLLGVGVILVFLYVRFPYLLHDCRYAMKILEVRSKRNAFRRKTPFYTILDCFLDAVKRQPHKDFLIFEDEVYTYLQADRASNKAARALKRYGGLREGDTVALFLGNEPDLVWLWLGLFKLGCAVSFLNSNIRKKSLLHCFSCCGAKVLIAGAEQQAAVCEVLPELCAQNVCVFILGHNSNVEGMQTLTDKIEESSDAPVPHTLRANVTMSSLALHIYTSGTTGIPKASLFPQDRTWGGTLFLALSGAKADDIIYISMPLYHAAGLLIGLAGAVERGMTVVLRRKFSASQFWNDCRKHNVTVIQYIGEIIRYVCKTPKRETDRQHSVRLAIGNGLRVDVWRTFQERFGPLDVKEFYAASDGNLSFINYVGKVGAVGRINFFQKKVFPHAIIQYNSEREEPVRDSRGHCVPVPKGETGLFVSKITKISPFMGYAGNPEQTERKRLRDVFQEGDVYFNSGDLMMIDNDNFIYFQDRIGDTFRWKGENVATTEVSDIILMLDFIQEANVYGVEVPGHEGRIGMAAVTIKEDQEFDCKQTFTHVTNYLPTYARPHFIRILRIIELTETYKQVKVSLMKEGFDPSSIPEPIYVVQESSQSYIPLTYTYYSSIISGEIRL